MNKANLPWNEGHKTLIKTTDGTREFSSFFPLSDEKTHEKTENGPFGPNGQKCAACEFERLQQLLDSKHLERWGLKEYYRDVDLELRPVLPAGKLFEISEGRLTWVFRNDPLFRKMDEDFACSRCSEKEAQSCYGPDPRSIEEWRYLNSPETGSQHIDLLYLSRYDHQAYAHFPEHPNDPWGYLNTDRFFFVTLSEQEYSPTELLSTVGNMHLHIHELSSMLIPGFADRDSNGLDGIFSLTFVTRMERQAKSLARRLKSFGRMLTLPSRTLEVRALSMEALEAFPNRENSICDLLGKISVAISPVK